jgi:response regulator of citrate/malate metabolism
MISVIIVEDDILVAELNKSYVENVQGFKVEKVFNNGEEALTYLTANEVDLMLLDVYMPKLNGIELLESIRKKGIMTDVILVTAAREANNIDKVLKLGAIDYLIKPFVYERIKKSLEGYVLRYNLMHDKSVFKQEEIDQITNNRFTNNFNDLQKGLNAKTLERIYEFMKKNSDTIYTSELVAEKTKMSRVTTRKYLDYLVSEGKVKTDIEYKDVGRPLTLYKYNKGSY